MPNEIELKLRIDAADASRLFAHPALAHGLEHGPLTRRLISTYFDTPDLRLLDAEISLRVRSMSGGWFQAVKAAGSSVAGLHQRMEWEDIISGSSPDFDKITEPSLAAIFADMGLRDALQPLFITDVERTEWQLRMADGTALEVALDLGELQVGSDIRETIREPISEVEVELKSGDPAQVFLLALELQADIALTIENISKAQRGYEHYRANTPELAPFSSTPLPPALDKAALAKLVWQCLHQLQSHQALLVADAAELRQHAVAQISSTLEYLLSALALHSMTPATLLAEYRWLQEAIAAVPADAQAPGLNTLLQGQRCQRLLLKTGAWLLA